VGVHGSLRKAVRAAMNLDYWLGAILSVLLTGYLIYALVRAERF
jgi:K+-transporting ATPase KdpF subunit